jgi:thymidylate synthase ThyX
MTITAQIVTDSISSENVRLTTMVLTYPRFIHAEFMTHRMFSRNAASSRAIPIKKMIEKIKIDPAMPIYWGKNQPGMQAAEELDDMRKMLAQNYWLTACDQAVALAEMMQTLDLHKQISNRILEPFMNITVICTATDWDNFFFLRLDPAAQPEIQALAREMYSAYKTSKPELVSYYNWHLPYVPKEEAQELGVALSKKCSAARCARVSYLNHDGTNPSIDKDLQLFNRLVIREDKTKPGHWSPLEHVATPLQSRHESSGNFKGWLQFRKEYNNEVCVNYEKK